MLRTLGLFALALLLLSGPASAVTSTEKMETCKVGAEAQSLEGAKAQAFIKKCMANKDEPRGAAAAPPPPAGAPPPPPPPQH